MARWLLRLIALTLAAQTPVVHGQAAAPIALTGQVSSAEEGPMEGVLISAKQDASTVTVTVVSDARGRYSFPSTRIGAGHYAIRIRAVGYELEGPTAVDVRKSP